MERKELFKKKQEYGERLEYFVKARFRLNDLPIDPRKTKAMLALIEQGREEGWLQATHSQTADILERVRGEEPCLLDRETLELLYFLSFC